MSPPRSRLENEIAHGRLLLAKGAGDVWNWETPAGRLRWARRVGILTAPLRPSMRVLELGCGTGYFTRELARTGATVVAIDVSPDLLSVARSEVGAANVTFQHMSAHELAFRDGSFDAVVGSSVLHHLDVDRAIGEVLRVLRPGGFAIFTEPNMANPQIALQKNIPALKRRLGDSPDETAFFRGPIRRRLSRAGFIGVTVTPFDFLHPGIPRLLIPMLAPLCGLAERIPLLREIAGSLVIRGARPSS